MFSPFAYMSTKSGGGGGGGIPTGSMIAWYDASNYTSGETWIDASPNGLDLTLTGTYSKDTSTIGGDSIVFNGGYAVSQNTNLLPGVRTGGDSEFTIIEVLKLISANSAQGTFV